MIMLLIGFRNSFPIINGGWASDLDGNGIFNSIDFAIMRQFLLGIIYVFPAEYLTKSDCFEYALISGDTENPLDLYGDQMKKMEM